MPIQIKSREFLKDTIYKKKLHIKSRDFKENKKNSERLPKRKSFFPNCMCKLEIGIIF